MSEPASDCSMDCLLSSAAFWPISGLPPAPRPRVSSLPIWMWQDEGTAAVAMACERAETGDGDASAIFSGKGDAKKAARGAVHAIGEIVQRNYPKLT